MAALSIAVHVKVAKRQHESSFIRELAVFFNPQIPSHQTLLAPVSADFSGQGHEQAATSTCELAVVQPDAVLGKDFCRVISKSPKHI